MNNLYPGLLGTCFSFFFGTLTCLIFTCAHISHGSSFLSTLCPYNQQLFSEGALQYDQSSCGIIRLGYSFLVQSPHVLDPKVSVSLFPLAMMILAEFRQPLQVLRHLEMPAILVELGHIKRI